MRTGLLTRFMGALGIVVGVLQVIQYGSALPLVQTFWLGGLALLFAGRRPGGDPPAWRTGRAEPWPTAQQAAEQRRAAAEAEAAAGGAAPAARASRERVPAGAAPGDLQAQAQAPQLTARGARAARTGYHSPQHCRFS